jgi:NADH-quinone oxidoreductase subunit L
VIIGMHHEQDMRRMGGLWKLMPITYAVMLIGTLAITGVGLPVSIGGHEYGFAGFYSKDSIINAAWNAHDGNAVATFAFIVGILAAGLTSFYSWRLIFMTFHGTPKWAHAHGHDHDHADEHQHASSAQIETHTEPLPDHGHGDDHADHTPHESPWIVIIPLLALAVGAVFAGGLFAEKFIGAERMEFWRGAIFTLPSNTVLAEHELPWQVLWAPLTVTAIGFVVAWYYYVLHEGLAKRLADYGGPLHAFLYNKWYFDEAYDFIFVRGAKALGDLFWKGGDQKIIDGLGPEGVAAVSEAVGKEAGRLQSGYVYHYAFVMLLGVAGLLTFALIAWRG